MPFPLLSETSSTTPGLFHSVRSFWRALIGNLHARLELLVAELEDEAVRIAYLVISGFVGVLALHAAFFFAMLWVLALVWDTAYRLWVIGGIFLVYFALGAGCVAYAWSLISSRPKFLGQTLTELKRDVDGFKPTPSPQVPTP